MDRGQGPTPCQIDLILAGVDPWDLGMADKKKRGPTMAKAEVAINIENTDVFSEIVSRAEAMADRIRRLESQLEEIANRADDLCAEVESVVSDLGIDSELGPILTARACVLASVVLSNQLLSDPKGTMEPTK